MNMQQKPKTSVIVARASDHGIGCSDGLPWHIPAELKYFKERTLKKPVIMGRKTFESIVKQFGKPLPGRTNIVVSRSGFNHPEAMAFTNLDDAIEEAKKVAAKSRLDEIFIIGGSEIFKQTLPIADTVYLTEIHGTFKQANAYLYNEDIHFERLKLASVKSETLEEKLFDASVQCDFKVFEKAASL